MKNPSPKRAKVITVRKANYFVLLLPLSFLVFSIWGLVSSIDSQLAYPIRIQETNLPAQNLDKVVFSGLLGVIILIAVTRNVFRNKKITVENFSVIAFSTGYLLLEVGDYLHLSPTHWSRLLSLILGDVTLLIIIINLLRDIPFAGISMYQNKRIIIR